MENILITNKALSIPGHTVFNWSAKLEATIFETEVSAPSEVCRSPRTQICGIRQSFRNQLSKTDVLILDFLEENFIDSVPVSYDYTLVEKSRYYDPSEIDGQLVPYEDEETIAAKREYRRILDDPVTDEDARAQAEFEYYRKISIPTNYCINFNHSVWLDALRTCVWGFGGTVIILGSDGVAYDSTVSEDDEWLRTLLTHYPATSHTFSIVDCVNMLLQRQNVSYEMFMLAFDSSADSMLGQDYDGIIQYSPDSAFMLANAADIGHLNTLSNIQSAHFNQASVFHDLNFLSSKSLFRWNDHFLEYIYTHQSETPIVSLLSFKSYEGQIFFNGLLVHYDRDQDGPSYVVLQESENDLMKILHKQIPSCLVAVENEKVNPLFDIYKIKENITDFAAMRSLIVELHSELLSRINLSETEILKRINQQYSLNIQSGQQLFERAMEQIDDRIGPTVCSYIFNLSNSSVRPDNRAFRRVRDYFYTAEELFDKLFDRQSIAVEQLELSFLCINYLKGMESFIADTIINTIKVKKIPFKELKHPYKKWKNDPIREMESFVISKLVMFIKDNSDKLLEDKDLWENEVERELDGTGMWRDKVRNGKAHKTPVYVSDRMNDSVEYVRDTTLRLLLRLYRVFHRVESTNSGDQ